MAGFWQNADSNPKRNYTYRVTIGDKVAFWAKAVTLPTFDVSNVEIHHFDNRYYFPGRVTWNPVSITMVDPISEDVAKLVSNFLQPSYQVPASEGDKSKSLERKALMDAIGPTVKIEVYDPKDTKNTIVETWELKNPFIESAKYGDLAYDSDDLKTIEISIRYDYAKHDQAAFNVP